LLNSKKKDVKSRRFFNKEDEQVVETIRMAELLTEIRVHIKNNFLGCV
jgi:hypothetical protein